MMILVDSLLILSMVVLLILAALFTLEILLGLCYRRRDRVVVDELGPSTVILIPAHNEANTIECCLQQLQSERDANHRVVVVADNCSDNTAELARRFAVEVLERNDHSALGKGYAIDFGVRSLAANPPEVLVLLDADGEFEKGGLRRVVAEVQALQRPVQAFNFMQTVSGSTPRTRIADFAWLVRNLARPLGLRFLQLPCQVQGSGFAAPWSILNRIKLATGNIVEDLEHGLDFTRAGCPVMFCPEVSVMSYFPVADSARIEQRKRWEHGHLSVIMSHALKMLWGGLMLRNVHMLVLALDLCIPPLALFVAVLQMTLVLAVGGWLVGGSVLPVLGTLVAIAILGLGVGVAWLRYGRQTVSLQDLASIPKYLWGKLSLYVDFVIRRQREWVRADRDS